MELFSCWKLDNYNYIRPIDNLLIICDTLSEFETFSNIFQIYKYFF